MLPLKYVLKSLDRRRLRTLLTITGVALTIALYVAMAAVSDTMVRAFAATGAPTEVVISQAGSLNVEFSNVERGTRTFVETLDGVAQADGRALVGPELYLRGEGRIGDVTDDITIRGVTDIAPKVYGEVSLTEGRWPEAGHTATVGRAMVARYGIAVSDTLGLEGARFTVVGVLDSGGRVYDQEVWVDLDDLAAETNRADYSSYTVRTTDPVAAAALVDAIAGSRRFPIAAMPAASFYAQSGAMAQATAGLARFIAFIIVLGAIFAGMNVMYSAVAGRRREIGVLRALGFRRGSILLAFLVESLLICGVAGVLGIVLGSAIAFVPLDLPYVVEQRVHVGAPQAVGAVVVAVVIGLFGGLLPALQAARIEVVDALRW